jgi:hypothetical protein
MSRSAPRRRRARSFVSPLFVFYPRTVRAMRLTPTPSWVVTGTSRRVCPPIQEYRVPPQGSSESKREGLSTTSTPLPFREARGEQASGDLAEGVGGNRVVVLAEVGTER